MELEWIATSIALPVDGQKVQFLLDRRDRALEGCYRHCHFSSRWFGYSPAVVRQWRKVSSVPAQVPGQARETGTPFCTGQTGIACAA